jgi:hypothetical protein
LSTTVTDPRIDPPPVGVSDTVKPHFPFAARTKPLLQGIAPEGLMLYSPEAVRFDRVNDEALAFITCTDVLLVDPIAMLLKLKDVGANVSGFVAGPPVAVPLRLTDCGLKGTPVVVSLTASPPFTDPDKPSVVGLNVTLKVHAAAALSMLPQGVTPPAMAAKSPPAAHKIFWAVTALFRTVTINGLLVLPTVVEGNTKLVGVSAIVTSPVPESVIRCGAPLTPLSLIVIAPAIDPITAGENVTLRVHDAPVARGLWLTQLSASP